MKRKNIPLIVGFCLLLAFIHVTFFILPKTEFSENEKRVLQAAPKFSFSSLRSGKLFSSVDSFIADHFTGRDFWIGLNAYYQQFCGLNATGEVYQGKDGWLIERPVEFGKIFSDNKQAISDFAAQTDTPMTLLCIPSTGYMMPEKLPVLHDPYPDRQMLEQLQEICTGNLLWVDLEPVLRRASDDAYYRTDHHWTSTGAFSAYQALCTVWGIEPADASKDYKIERYDSFYGTTYSKSGLWSTPPDYIELWNDTSVTTQVAAWDENKPFPTEQEGMFFRSHLQQADKYPVFLDGNHALVHITSSAPSGKLLIVRDSFAHCLAPFLARHFQTIDLVDLRYFKEQSVTERIGQEDYDQILFVYGLSSLAEDRSIQWLT